MLLHELIAIKLNIYIYTHTFDRQIIIKLRSLKFVSLRQIRHQTVISYLLFRY